MKKREFDVIVIGAGSGLIISSYAANKGLKVAIVEEGPFGGTCLNRGCIPSKMLIHVADVIEIIKKANLFGVEVNVNKIDWKKIQKWVWNTVDPSAKDIEEANKSAKNITVYKTRGEFVDKKVLKVKDELITAEKIFICAGTRPNIPEIEGLNDINYITSNEALRLEKQPKKMAIIGGGYISAELGHFFSSLGTDVKIVYRGERLLKNEDGEIAEAFTKIVSKKYNVMLNTDILKVSKKGNNIAVKLKQNKKEKEIIVDTLLLTTGRVSNTDILKVEKTNVKTKNGFIEVNKYMETNVPGIFAIGDVVGRYQFKHSANLEANYCVYNAFNPTKKIEVDYSAMPHAIFTSPQIAGVGFTEQELKEKNIKYLTGKYNYYKTGMGKAIEDKDGFVKVLVDLKTKEILGCHILGYDAATLIQEVIVAMKNKLGVKGITDAVHIHPALPEVVLKAFNSIKGINK